MKIAIIGTTAGSLYGFRASFIRALVAAGHDVHALAYDYDDDSRRKVRELGAWPVDHELDRAGLNPFRVARATYRLAGSLKAIRPDVVFSYFAKPVVFGTLAAVVGGIQRRVGMLEGLGYAFTVGPEGLSRKQRVLRRVQLLLYRVALPRLDRVIFLNPDDRHELLDDQKIPVRSNAVLGGIGVDLTQYALSSPRVSPVTFIFVGRLLAEKGVNEYIKAARRVKALYPEARFRLLGGVDEANPGGLSQANVEALLDEGLVEYPGHVDNVAEWISDSSVFVLPSYREGVPRSTQEAMAMGRCVITTDVPGCRETVVDGENGFLVPPWSPDALADRMIRLIENPEDIATMGLTGHRMAVERFDEQKVTARLIGLLTD